MTTIAIVGTGPTGVYAFKALATAPGTSPLTIWLFEKGADAGVGMPYSDDTASPVMLANIASIEIPPVTRSYLDWLGAQTGALLRSYGIDPDDLDERDFTPRLMLGRYYRDEFDALVHAAEALGHRIELRERTEVTDIRPGGDGRLWLITDHGEIEEAFDKVVVATGHAFPEDQDSRKYFPSPWSGLVDTVVPACRVGILGTSLSAIDAAMAVASQHGRFVARRGTALLFEPNEAQAEHRLSITMMSRSGVLPEADFYCPIPYQPLAIMTPARLAELSGRADLLDAVFDVFREELALADPAYAETIGLTDATPDDIAERYFRNRKATAPFEWARRNLAEVEANRAAKATVPWRYAILRMHEAVEELVEEFSDQDHKRFDSGLKTMFVDNYAAVPPESIRRLLALHDAGFLEVRGLGSSWDMDETGNVTTIRTADVALEFDIFIDARGQKPLEAADLPFPSLRSALLAEGVDILEVDDDYTLLAAGPYDRRVRMGAIPYLMHDRPFVQGITAACEIGTRIGNSLLRQVDSPQGRRRRFGYWSDAGPVPVRRHAAAG
ncbi:FAD/NAD(P)-binding protein [Paracoccus sp. S1E-3]|uniref:FAD/NAD(P)-binding protein n=2 Tax=Paracoccus TaxID=265 RepID=UPI0015EEB075|nr:FAD/NAD(P)-binding protein [Paracoccus sp. S1E-3]MBA4491609.1 FAD/NAD(P)-binding protein [Paracoccus sp. S1E-3]